MRVHLSRATRGRAVVGALVLVCASVPVADALQSRTSSGDLPASGPPLDAALLQVQAPTDNAGTFSTQRSPRTGPLVATGSRAPSAGPGTTVIDQTPAQRVKQVSADTRYGIPRAALTAYKRAAIVMAGTEPGCNLDWSVLAAIGQVESDQGRYGGSHVLADGIVSPTIVGMRLDGHDNTARIPDTDNGRLDGDTVWDRAVGPMQFLPSTWAVVGVDGDGDGVRNPNDFDDAALSAAVYLCVGHHDMSTHSGAAAAVYSYNHSQAYVSLVLALAARFAKGDVAVVPNDTNPGTPSGDGGTSNGSGKPHKPHQPHGHKPHGGHGNPPQPPPPPPSGPGQPPKPPGPPSPHPGNAPTIVEGTLLSCVTDPPAEPTTSLWCVSVDNASTAVDLGDNADLSTVQGDYNGDGTAASVTDELTSLLGLDVRFQLDDDGLVEQINDLAYRVIAASPTPTDPTTTPTEPPTTPTKPTATPAVPTATSTDAQRN